MLARLYVWLIGTNGEKENNEKNIHKEEKFLIQKEEKNLQFIHALP
jgi:hypothetical protein